ncbi:hypothetical protein BRD17_08525 [Halobacteriales archaeon SW_7_68_16]|nr:MAG: hypothetical protein BRD17_08525 [Halobacteriales archaeon SW_7_68_16]
MRLDEFVADLERDREAERRELAREKSYEITEYLADTERRFDEVTQGSSLFGSTAPSIFVGRSSYPDVAAGVLAPVDDRDHAADYETGPHWYRRGFTIDDVFQARTNLLNSTQRTSVHVADEWSGFTGVQREVAIADRPVDVEVGLDGPLDVDLDVGFDDVATPTGPRATAESATLAENPHVPRAVEKTLEDDDWRATGAMNYLYERGFDVYDVNSILSAGALGRTDERKLVPTRWSITAVDDTIGQFLRGRVRSNPSIDTVQVHYNEFLANRFWIVLAPGDWEFELVELKAPGSVWNPDPDRGTLIATDYEPATGRTAYVDETAGAYHAARLGVLEYLDGIDRRATARQVRESVRDAFGDRHGTAESLGAAVRRIADTLPVPHDRLRRTAELVAAQQTSLDRFG